VYRVEDSALIVMVLAVDRREDSLAYRAAQAHEKSDLKDIASRKVL